MPDAYPKPSDETLQALFNKSEDILNRSQLLQAQGARLSRQLAMLHEQSEAAILHSQNVLARLVGQRTKSE